uniref:CBS domain-containing protein n=1 Tax=Macrostomum lignano TaxID=282301 RepID=A0A1I8JR59_9PLAT
SSCPPDKLQQFKNDTETCSAAWCNNQQSRESPGHVGQARQPQHSSRVDVLVVVKLRHSSSTSGGSADGGSGGIQRSRERQVHSSSATAGGDSSTVDLEEIRETTLPHPGRVFEVFSQRHRCYDLDTTPAASCWFVFYRSALVPMEELESHKIDLAGALQDRLRPFMWISPEASLLDAIRLLCMRRTWRQQRPTTTGPAREGGPQYRHDRFEGVTTCKATDSLRCAIEKLVIAECTPSGPPKCVVGVVSLLDILSAIVLKHEDLQGSVSAGGGGGTPVQGDRWSGLSSARALVKLVLRGLSPRYCISWFARVIRPLHPLPGLLLSHQSRLRVEQSGAPGGRQLRPDAVLPAQHDRPGHSGALRQFCLTKGLLFAALKRTECSCGISMDGMRLAEAGSLVDQCSRRCTGDTQPALRRRQRHQRLSVDTVGAHPAAAAVLRWLLDGPVEPVGRNITGVELMWRAADMSQGASAPARQPEAVHVEVRKPPNLLVGHRAGLTGPLGRLRPAAGTTAPPVRRPLLSRKSRLKATSLAWPSGICGPGSSQTEEAGSDKTGPSRQPDSDRLQEAGGARGGGRGGGQPVALGDTAVAGGQL